MSTSSFNLDMPSYRPLKVYAFDPTHGRNLGNYMTINVPYEDVRPGPVGEYLAVIDYDANNGCYYHPVDLNAPPILIRNGLDPSESDPMFHQQMVYAVASETIRRFSFALGRTPGWGFRGGKRTDSLRRHLRIFPHAMQEPNAYYSRKEHAIMFGYFPASESDPGVNLPGQTIFTCLSHDIIVHETTHALVDGQRDLFMQPTGPDAFAFHEAFADIVALFQHFSFKEALLEMIERTGGLIYRLDIDPEIKPSANGALITSELGTTNPMVELAKQFGEAMGMRSALRSAIGTPPNSNALETVFEPHYRGSILVAAVFDAFFSVYIRRTRDLMRIARAGGSHATDLHPDLVNRLAEQASKIAQHFSNICIRALDYCPPVDILFGDFLRALITADYDLVPDDPHGYRGAIIEAFRLRGIRPDGVTSYAEESLRWCSPEVFKGVTPPPCEGLEFDQLKPLSKDQKRRNATILSRYGKANAIALGLVPGEPVQAHSFHTIRRVGPDGQIASNIVAELVQQTEEHVDPSDPASRAFKFYGGTTVIFDENHEVRYAIQKRLHDELGESHRLTAQREFFAQLESDSAALAFCDANDSELAMNFDLIHRGF